MNQSWSGLLGRWLLALGALTACGRPEGAVSPAPRAGVDTGPRPGGLRHGARSTRPRPDRWHSRADAAHRWKPGRPDIHQIVDTLRLRLPNATTAVFDGVGHLPSMEQPVRFSATVLNFLRSRRPH